MEKAMTELAAEHFTPLIDRYTLVVITFSFVIHYSLFRFSSTSDEKDAPTRARYPSQAHALFVCGFVLWWMTQYDWGLWDDKYLMRMLHGEHGTGDELQPYVLAYSIGYFLSDSLVMLTHDDVWDKTSIVHHVVITPAFLLALHFRVGSTFQFFYLLEELSTIPLNLKWFYRNSSWYEFWGLSFSAMFFLSRFVWGGIVFYSVYRVWNEHGEALHAFSPPHTTVFLSIWFLCLLTRILNTYWLFLIAVKVRKALTSKGEVREKTE